MSSITPNRRALGRTAAASPRLRLQPPAAQALSAGLLALPFCAVLPLSIAAPLAHGNASGSGNGTGNGGRAAQAPSQANGPVAAPAAAPAAANGKPSAPTPVVLLRRQTVAPLPGSLDRVPVLNDNNPELITSPGILLSTFSGQGRGTPSAHLDRPLQGPFELFSHHVYAGRPETLDSTLWIAVLAAPRGKDPVTLRVLSGSTALSQSLDPGQPSAPFLPLPPLISQDSTSPVFAGPGSRVATELLQRSRSPLLPEAWTLPPGQISTLLVLPLPVRGLDPLLNGRNLQLRLDSSGPVDMATVAGFGNGAAPPSEAQWRRLLDGALAPREHAPSPQGAPGPVVYSRVSGVQLGSSWRARLTDPGSPTLSASRAPISWPISSLVGGSLGTRQVQTAALQPYYPGTAWAAHGNYGLLYDLSIPLRNDSAGPQRLQLALDSPLKTDPPLGGLRFRATPGPAVTFRGTVEVSGLDGDDGRPVGRRGFHLVLRSGQQGPSLGTVSLAPGQTRLLQVRLIYPADATPPQALTLLPAPAPPLPRADGAGLPPAVKQSGSPPASSP
ncbi:MAG: DUF3370 domain-containing protein [Synechococcaceae cyanobacterium]|nr:DUF3370 domain-containing protein [Synechococcaceae cyanobacterium]